jgi:hypothetical protein
VKLTRGGLLGQRGLLTFEWIAPTRFNSEMVPQRAEGAQKIRCFMWSLPTEESAAALGLAAEVEVRSERPSTHSNVGGPACS